MLMFLKKYLQENYFVHHGQFSKACASSFTSLFLINNNIIVDHFFIIKLILLWII